MKWFILAIFLISTTLAADSSNQFRVPYCSPNVQKLPIYQMSVKTKDGSTLSSTVVLVGPNMWATSAHGVAYGEVKEITISLPTGKTKAKITWFDKSMDIAVLQGKSYNIRPIDSMSYDLGDREQIWNIGYASIADGEIMSFTGFKVRYNKSGMLVTTALGLIGMSGGASVRCIGEHLELVGIITAKVNYKIDTKVWTDEAGILNQIITITNKGISLISPMKFQK